MFQMLKCLNFFGEDHYRLFFVSYPRSSGDKEVDRKNIERKIRKYGLIVLRNLFKDNKSKNDPSTPHPKDKDPPPLPQRQRTVVDAL